MTIPNTWSYQYLVIPSCPVEIAENPNDERQVCENKHTDNKIISTGQIMLSEDSKKTEEILTPELIHKASNKQYSQRQPSDTLQIVDNKSNATRIKHELNEFQNQHRKPQFKLVALNWMKNM